VNKDKIKILLVDDEALIRQGLRALLEKESFIGEIFEASDGNEFTAHLKKHKIDVVLMDIRLRDTTGLELINSIKKEHDRLKIVAVTGLEGVELIINLLKSGVDGIVYKLDGYDEIRKTIKSILASGNYFPEKILRIIQVNAARWDNIPPVSLSTQEMEILKGIAKGSVTKEIARELKMAEGTAETYRLRLLKKVGVSNTAALMAYAFRNGLL
jgi:DNA-binding NarL/FixJ family response regulator